MQSLSESWLGIQFLSWSKRPPEEWECLWAAESRASSHTLVSYCPYWNLSEALLHISLFYRLWPKLFHLLSHVSQVVRKLVWLRHLFLAWMPVLAEYGGIYLANIYNVPFPQTVPYFLCPQPTTTVRILYLLVEIKNLHFWIIGFPVILFYIWSL